MPIRTLPDRFVVFDHHGVSDPSEEPSSIVQVALAVGARPTPLVGTLVHWIDLHDRYGSTVKRWSGVFGNSLNFGLTKYFGDAAPTGLVKETNFLELLADAFYSKARFELRDFAEAYKIAEKLTIANIAEQYPRTFQILRLMFAEDCVYKALMKLALKDKVWAFDQEVFFTTLFRSAAERCKDAGWPWPCRDAIKHVISVVTKSTRELFQ